MTRRFLVPALAVAIARRLAHARTTSSRRPKLLHALELSDHGKRSQRSRSAASTTGIRADRNQAYYIRGWPMISEVPANRRSSSNNTTDSKYQQDTYTYDPGNEWLWRTWAQMYGAIVRRISSSSGSRPCRCRRM